MSAKHEDFHAKQSGESPAKQTKVKEEIPKQTKITKKLAKEAATEAQAYSGENLDNIAFGGFLGALAAKFGLIIFILQSKFHDHHLYK